MAWRLDVTDRTASTPPVAETVAAFGRIDVLINNAAIFTAAPIVEIDDADYQRAFDINVAGTLFTPRPWPGHDRANGIRGRDHQHGLAGRAAGRGSSPSIARRRPR
jgi:NAD(P)-dependent dehydrogenase (short-subunit alcohol dehydrogenase family)